jgi:hypothetical protein
MSLIESEPILKFIVDGLNSGKFGHDAIEILTEIRFAPDGVVHCKDCVKCGSCGEETNLGIMGFCGFCSRGRKK